MREKASIKYGALGVVETITHKKEETTEIVVTSPTPLVVSDGYHTFDELYDHRITLFIALCKSLLRDCAECSVRGKLVGAPEVWRSKLHADGSSFDGWFVLGINKKPGEQITYHLPLDRWNETDFAETLERGPEFDGHKPTDVLERLKNL